jgi:hypothetical protein
MRGSIREKGKRCWQIQIYSGSDSNGKPRRHFETVRGRKGDAQRRLTELLSSLDKGVYTPPGKMLLLKLNIHPLTVSRMLGHTCESKRH